MKVDYKAFLPALLSGLAFVGLWYGLIAWFDISPFFLPPFHAVIEALWEEGPRLLAACWVTARYGLAGLGLAVVVGVALSVFLCLSRVLRQAFYPWVLLVQMTPVVIFAPIIVLWFDYGAASVVTITFITSFFPVVANTTFGLVSAEPALVDCLRLYGARRWQELWVLRIPHALPSMINGVRIAATLVPIGAVFGEFFVGSFEGGRGGLGLLVFIYNKQTRIPELFAVGMVACLLGFVLVMAIQGLNRWLLHRWHESYAPHNRE
jgi:NitT/TauT family transport system permease protein